MHFAFYPLLVMNLSLVSLQESRDWCNIETQLKRNFREDLFAHNLILH